MSFLLRVASVDPRWNNRNWVCLWLGNSLWLAALSQYVGPVAYLDFHHTDPHLPLSSPDLHHLVRRTIAVLTFSQS